MRKLLTFVIGLILFSTAFCFAEQIKVYPITKKEVSVFANCSRFQPTIFPLPNLNPAPDVGDPAPDFSLKTLDGSKTYTLYDYTGNVIWLDWFSVNWEDCVAELPHLNDMATGYKTTHPNNKFFIICCFDKASKCQTFQDQYPSLIFLTDYPDKETFYAYTHDYYVPLNYVLRKNLVVHYWCEGFDETEGRQKFEEAYEYQGFKQTTWGSIKRQYLK